MRDGKRQDWRRRLVVRDYTMWLAAMVAVALLALPWVITLAQAPHHHLDATTVGILAAVSIPLSALWLAWVTLAKGGGSSAPVSSLNIDQVADQLAIAVGAQWNAEAAIRRLNDPYPLPVCWTAADPSLTDDWDSLVKLATSGAGWPPSPPASPWAAGPDELAGKDNELVEVLARVPTGRLVVLGEPGAGKTMLMVRLVLDLLARRGGGGPVPFLASVASWNPAEQDLRAWLEGQLLIDHPALANLPPANRAESNQAAALLAAGLILPVLDGLDEIPSEVRGPAISRINDALQPGEQVVVTCRSKEYRKAVRPGSGVEVTLRAVAAVQLNPLDADTVRSYLCDDAAGPVMRARWEPVLDVLGTEAPAGQALSTPLMVGLARAIYNPRPGELIGTLHNPSELCKPGLKNRKAVELLLFDAFIPAAYRDDAPGRWKRQGTGKWLVFLACHLDLTIGSPDLAWWQLRRAVPRTAFLLAALLGATPLLAFGFVLISGLQPELGPSFAKGLRYGFVIGVGTGLMIVFAVWLVSMQVYLPRIIHRNALIHRNARAPSRGMRISFGWLGFGLGAGFAFGLLIGLVAGVAAGLAEGLGVGLGLGLAAGLVAGLAAGFTTAPGDLASAASPQAVLARDQRTVLVLMITSGLTAGLLTAVAAGLRFGLAAGLGFGLAAGLVVGLLASGNETAWPLYMLTKGWLALRHRLPWSLMAFLADAHQRGVLRQVGAVYQFRHIELQHRLANRDSVASRQ